MRKKSSPNLLISENRSFNFSFSVLRIIQNNKMSLLSQNDWIRRSLFTNQIELLAAFYLKYQLSFNVSDMTKSVGKHFRLMFSNSLEHPYSHPFKIWLESGLACGRTVGKTGENGAAQIVSCLKMLFQSFLSRSYKTTRQSKWLDLSQNIKHH